MRYPTDLFKENWNITSGYGFGAVTSYGRHEGVDLNKNGGGDIELGDAICAIADGQLLYYHISKHTTTGFGYHSVYRIEGSWGVRWVHQAHMQANFIQTVTNIKEGQIIGRVGKSGTQYAHIHFSIFKVDPATLRDGIDTIARNEEELNAWWEDPIKFIERWIDPQVQVSAKKFEELVSKASQWDEVTKLGYYSIAALKADIEKYKAHKCPTVDTRYQRACNDIQQIINGL